MLHASHVRDFPSGDGLAFSAAEGGALRHRNFMRRHFRPAVERAGLPEALRFHDLRHTFASLLLADRTPIEVVSRILGHSSIRVTMDTYGHLRDDAFDAYMDALNARAARGARGENAGGTDSSAGADVLALSEYDADLRQRMERTTGFEPATLTLAR